MTSPDAGAHHPEPAVVVGDMLAKNRSVTCNLAAVTNFRLEAGYLRMGGSHAAGGDANGARVDAPAISVGVA